jgi:hypothetical protein
MTTCHLCQSTKCLEEPDRYCHCPPSHSSCVNHARSDEDRPMVPNGPLWVCPTCHQRYFVAQAQRYSYRWIKCWVYGRLLAHVTYLYLIVYFIISMGIQIYKGEDDYTQWYAYALYSVLGAALLTMWGLYVRGTKSKWVRRTYREVLVRAYPPTAIE